MKTPQDFLKHQKLSPEDMVNSAIWEYVVTAMQDHARQAVTYALEQAAENALTEEHPADYYKAPEMKREIVDKSSILSLKEQILKELGI